LNPRINLRHLQTFLAIVEEGTLTAAAERQLKSQGAISQDLASLETECGLKLIDRSGQRVKLTPAGEALLPEAREILERVRDVELSMRRIRSGEAGTIRIGALPSITERVAEYLFDFHKRVPEARFELRSELHGSLLEKLNRRELDIIIAMTTLRENLECKVLESEPLFIVVNSTHPLANRDSLTPHDVAGFPFVSMMRDVSYARGGKDFFEVVGRYPDPLFETDDHRAIQLLVRNGAGYGILPKSALTTSPDLIAIPTRPRLERQLALLRVQTHRSPALSDIYQFFSREWGSH
jgi:DNA-binding transcriptional LysR family regulator